MYGYVLVRCESLIMAARKNIVLPDHNGMQECLANCAGQYVFPGGKLVDSDETLYFGTMREFVEETGVMPDILHPVYSGPEYTVYIWDTDYSVVGKINENLKSGDTHSRELYRVEWYAVDELPELFDIVKVPTARDPLFQEYNYACSKFGHAKVRSKMNGQRDWFVSIVRDI